MQADTLALPLPRSQSGPHGSAGAHHGRPHHRTIGRGGASGGANREHRQRKKRSYSERRFLAYQHQDRLHFVPPSGTSASAAVRKATAAASSGELLTGRALNRSVDWLVPASGASSSGHEAATSTSPGLMTAALPATVSGAAGSHRPLTGVASNAPSRSALSYAAVVMSGSATGTTVAASSPTTTATPLGALSKPTCGAAVQQRQQRQQLSASPAETVAQPGASNNGTAPSASEPGLHESAPPSDAEEDKATAAVVVVDAGEPPSTDLCGASDSDAVAIGTAASDDPSISNSTSNNIHTSSTRASPSPSTSALEAGGPELRLAVGVAMIPHPAKKAKGGEDAYFVGADGQTVGVADGVGGWEALGVDSGLYSRSLMAAAAMAAQADPTAGPARLLHVAHDRCAAIPGSSTACILHLAPAGVIHAVNLGDSGFLLVRDGRVLYRSKEQTHYYNCPYQIGSSRDLPDDAARITVPGVQEGDMIVLATDGVFDNLYADRILALIDDALNATQGRPPADVAAAVAQVIAIEANRVGADGNANTPFQEGARRNGQIWKGGKLDDVTALCCVVTPSKCA